MGKLGLGLGLGRSRRTASAPAGPTLGPDLITNGGFGTTSNWTLTAGSLSPNISGGTLNFTQNLGDESQQKATQNLGSDQPAGTYRITVDVSNFVNDASAPVRIVLQGPSSEFRGASSNFTGNGAALTFDIVASGTVRIIQFQATDNHVHLDNVKMQLLS
jgi:hypothetical protein